MKYAWIGLLACVAACGGDDTYIVQGVVVEVNPPHEVVLDHEEIPRLMGPMTMPFAVEDPALLEGLEPGHKVRARLVIEQDGSHLAKLRVYGKGPAPEVPEAVGPAPLRPGQILPATTVTLPDGTSLVVGEGQAAPTALTFLYTTCPIPEMCPATVARLQALQEQVAGEAQLVAVTLDPEHDTPEVLSAFASSVGARGETWRFARLEGEALSDLALRSALTVSREDEIVHSTRWLILDADGRLIERYDDNRLPLDRVVKQLKTGEPHAPPGSSGTITGSGNNPSPADPPGVEVHGDPARGDTTPR